MRSGKELLQDFLEHAGDYDPAKAHEYYVRTRRLKGRKPGAGGDGGRRSPPTPDTPSGKSPATKTKTQEERVAAVQRRLDRLKEVLDRLVEEAKVRSGVEPESDSSKKSESSDSTTPDKPKTRQQQKKDAEAAKERRQKEDPQSLSAQERTLRAEVEATQKKIADIREQLRAAVEKARGKRKPTASSKPETKPVTKQPTANEGRHH